MKDIKKKLKYYLIERQSKWNLLIVIIPFIISVVYIYSKRNPIISGNYTIGTITRNYWPIVSPKSIMYKYNVRNNYYTNSQTYRLGEVGKRYLIQFSLEDPSYSNIFQDIPVPDSIREAPPEGWKELPGWAKKKK